jgi:two-component system, LuxR family, sensor kinase FixL
VAFNTTRSERDWPDALVKRLQLVAQIFANALARKRADQDLRESEARMAAGTDLAGLGYYEVDYGEGHCFLDERFRDICGVPPDLQQGLQPVEFWMKHVHPDDLQSILGERRKLHDGKIDRMSAEYRYRHPAHGQKWIHHLARIAAHSTAGQGVCTFGVVRDITDRKQLSERLQSAAAEWQATFDSIQDSVMIIDPDYRILRFNAAALRFLGLPIENIVGSACYTLLHGTSHPIEGCPCQKTFQTGLSSKLETFHAGSGKWLLISTDPIRDAAGNVTGVVHVGRDITEAKRAERETQELRNNLMHLTRVNTMSALSGSLAHELNQPLSIILSNAQAAQDLLLLELPDVAEVQSILSDIVAADRRAGEVIQRLRALLKHGQVSLQPLPLNEVIEEVLRLTNADLIGHGIKIVRKLAPGLPPVAGDRVQLQQLVLNLILNAADAMAANEPGTRRLHLQTMLHQGRAHASVRDEGAGLPEDVERLFQPFYTTKAQGLGMGLAICRSIVDAHRGRLWAEPHPEGGAVFHFELPVAGSTEKP